MSDRDPEWWASLANHLMINRLVWFSGGSAFLLALWSGIADGKGWRRSAMGGVICVVIAVGLIAALHASGLYQDWWPMVGIFVGFVGAERIRDAVLGAWDARRKLVNRSRDNSGKDN